ncbi:hypothetical protein RF11_00469 [Thelohanellus kitauei]|uniref:Uncharacterized protein n=1 Tax=Thelohanellus kitauei TaxID=669202 RepID=A0A0C2INS2_THEKT|nr:hypothetical protein RF11_00469 [Thelohanellus kitauei]
MNMFKGCRFNNIEPPQTSGGFWRLFVADKISYMTLLKTPYVKDGELLDIKPFYNSALHLPVYVDTLSSLPNRSKSLIHFYSNNRVFAYPESLLYHFPYLMNIPITSQPYEFGKLHSFHIRDPEMYQDFIFKNGQEIGIHSHDLSRISRLRNKLR